MASGEPLHGLETLTSTTHLFIKQCVEVTEALMGFETQNKYEIVNSGGERVFYAVEKTNPCLVCCSKTSRPFTFKILDFTGKTVMYVKRPCSCLSCCGCRILDCCGLLGTSRVNVTTPDGTQIGQVVEGCSLFSPKYWVKSGDGEKKLVVRGPSCVFCCNCKLMGNVEFEIHSVEDDEQCGRISKQFDGLEKQLLRSDADNYGICFPASMDTNLKATLLGAVLLIDFMYFEEDQGRNKEGEQRGKRMANLAEPE